MSNEIKLHDKERGEGEYLVSLKQSGEQYEELHTIHACKNDQKRYTYTCNTANQVILKADYCNRFFAWVWKIRDSQDKPVGKLAIFKGIDCIDYIRADGTHYTILSDTPRNDYEAIGKHNLPVFKVNVATCCNYERVFDFIVKDCKDELSQSEIVMIVQGIKVFLQYDKILPSALH